VTRGAARFSRHKHVGSFTALRRGMANIAVERLLGCRMDLMFGVIEKTAFWLRKIFEKLIDGQRCTRCQFLNRLGHGLEEAMIRQRSTALEAPR